MKVLIIDDDSQMRDYVSMYLETGFDCEILEASSGNEAQVVLDLEDDFDLILCEVFMKGGDGKDIIKFVTDRKMPCSFIWISKAENKTVTWVKESTVLGFIPKPFKDPDFFPLIEKAIEISKSRAPLKSKSQAPKTDNSTDSSFSFFEENKKHLEEKADWSLAKDVVDPDAEPATADWSLAKDEVDPDAEPATADWSLAKDEVDPDAEPTTADWSLAKDEVDPDAEAATADWSLAKDEVDPDAEPATADWSLADQEAKNNKLSQVRTEPTLSELKKSKTQRIKEKQEDNDYDKSKYKRVRIRRFLNFSNVSCDVFLKLKKEKYIKIINAGEGYNEEQLERYQKKSVRYVFIPIEQHEAFMHAFGDMVMDKLALVQNMRTEVKQAAELVIFDHIQNVASEYGISKKTATMVRGAIDSNIATLKRMGGVMNVISKMMQGKNYISEHSLLLSYIAGQICNNTSWGNQNSIEKLSMAALFHDCCIEDDNLARIHDQTNGIDKSWDKNDREMIEEHIGKAASMINAGESIFADVDTIVIQHHERPDGSGYPKKLGSLSISPISAIFIIAEDFVSRIYGKSKDEVEIKSIKKEFQEKYNKGNYKKPLKAFLDSF